MTKKEKLDQLIAYYAKGKPTVFAKKLSVAPSTISSWLSRDTLDYDLIFAKCEMINPKWLLSGNGEMLLSNTRSEVNLIDHNSIGFILDRYEALVRENVKLKEEINAIKSRERHSSNLVSPAYIEKEIRSMLVAEPEQEKLKK